jgi:hypothetical protein
MGSSGLVGVPLQFNRTVSRRQSDSSYKHDPGIGDVLHAGGDLPDIARRAEFIQ